MKIPELLAPVGSLEHLKIAINAGASAVYLSGKEYGARKYAKNFTLEEIHEAIKLAHLYNVKVYITVNTLIKESEIRDVLNYLEKLYQFGTDAVIVQDIGLIKLIKENIPNLNIYGSTQINAENQFKIDYLEQLGLKRIILPRELNSKEIAKIKTNMELEIFVHGALCYSYSGQCLLSSFKGGRSGNRGTCAQPCRQKYIIDNKEDNYLSPKDLCLFNYLEEITKLNINSIKIEGRMRNKEYLAIVISSYRKALNKLKANKKYQTEELDLVFNRGFTPGKFKNRSEKSIKSGHIGLRIGESYEIKKNQIAIKLKDSIKTIPEKGDGLLFIKGKNQYGLEISQDVILTTLNHYKKGKNKSLKNPNRKDRILIVKKVRENKQIPFDLTKSKVYLSKSKKITKKTKEIENNSKSYIKSKLTLTFSIKDNYPLLKGTLKLANNKQIKASVIGDKAFETPLRKVLDNKTIEKQLLKLGEYPFKVDYININYKENLFLPISEVNKLRRNLLSKLENEIHKTYEHRDFKLKFKTKNYKSKKSEEIEFSYYTNNLEDLRKLKNVKRVYLEIPYKSSNKNTININYMVSFLEEGMKIAINKDYELIWKWPDIAHDNLIKGLTKVNGILKKMHYNIKIMSPHFNGEYAPYSTNITNSYSLTTFLEKGYKIITPSVELTKTDLKNLMKNIENPNNIEVFVYGNIEVMKSRYNLFENNELKDKKGNIYPIYKNLSGKESIILNDKDYSILDEMDYLKSINITNFSIDGRWKDNEYYKIIDSYLKNKHTLEKTTKGNY